MLFRLVSRNVVSLFSRGTLPEWAGEDAVSRKAHAEGRETCGLCGGLAVLICLQLKPRVPEKQN